MRGNFHEKGIAPGLFDSFHNSQDTFQYRNIKFRYSQDSCGICKIVARAWRGCGKLWPGRGALLLLFKIYSYFGL